jgi:hypothetical protein
VTIRLALAVYFVLWLAWLIPWYVRRYHRTGPAAPPEGGRLEGRTLLYLVLWISLIIAIATVWRVFHPAVG